MNIEEARKVLWLKSNPRPLGELLDEGYLVKSGASKECDKELRPFVGRTLMPSVLDKAFKGEL